MENENKQKSQWLQECKRSGITYPITRRVIDRLHTTEEIDLINLGANGPNLEDITPEEQVILFYLKLKTVGNFLEGLSREQIKELFDYALNQNPPLYYELKADPTKDSKAA